MNQSKKKVLVVEDEPQIAEAISAYLDKNNYSPLIAGDGEIALDMFNKLNPDMVILDLMLPKLSGEEVCKAIRKTSRVPIIMLTAKITENEKITGLNIGADDYITKPFSPRELMARINSLFRRCGEGISPLYNVMTWNDNDLEIDFEQYSVKKQGELVNLTPNEFKILAALIKYPNKIFTREELIIAAFGEGYDGFDRTVDSHIKNLRSKIEDQTTEPQYIITVRGIGYKFGGRG